MPTILHITTRAAWQQAQEQGSYTAPSLVTEGFIHCSTPAQTAATASRLFRGVADLVLLAIDEDAVSSPVRYEAPASDGPDEPDELFPHVHGPLNLDAVVGVCDFRPNADGSFEVPHDLGASVRHP